MHHQQYTCLQTPSYRRTITIVLGLYTIAGFVTDKHIDQQIFANFRTVVSPQKGQNRGKPKNLTSIDRGMRYYLCRFAEDTTHAIYYI